MDLFPYDCSCIAFPILAQLITIDQLIQFLACKSQNTERKKSYLLFFHFLTEVGLQLIGVWNMAGGSFSKWKVTGSNTFTMMLLQKYENTKLWLIGSRW